ncbi:sugar transferase [Rhodospirillum rubrum]|uniref:TIGR03013 family XrtA/PEP-CTERM system glycosyltransferase n=1 Tax=Rhodospirillum rubrum TaxID=1085 RepID=UPI00190691C4|nr:TIGR03013 family XrtA/PEP-CTERM system glycosyltransferase [Rhodospirillum rubrum]MBK1665962.1 sugar transferase [Rhodospirillum rubrum]MBK1677191.1 sugar transferase [Rhodospirillum rubrum]
MIKILGHHISTLSITLAFYETLIFMCVLYSFIFIMSFFFNIPVPEKLSMVIILALTATIAAGSLGLYNQRIFGDFKEFIWRIALTLPLILLAVLFVSFAYGEITATDQSPFYLATAFGIPAGLLLVILGRGICFRIPGIKAFRRRILVLGTGEMADRLAALETSQPYRHYEIIGFVALGDDPAPLGEKWRVFDRSCIETRHDLLKICSDHNINEVIFAASERRRANSNTFGLPVWDLLECRLMGIHVAEYASFWERETGRIDLDHLRPGWLIFSEGFRNSSRRMIAKRFFDVITALLLVILTLPVLVAAAIAVKLSSPGPVFYRQERVGVNGKPFNLIKFRSMPIDAEKNGPVWGTVKDKRATGVGSLLRRTRIDEIPQVFNVLRGDMSFIGPRPERPVFVEELSRELDFYGERHAVRPGISGWAQINYPYGASVADAKQKLSYDLYYIKNGSLFLDIIILFQTFRVVLWPEGSKEKVGAVVR